MLPSEDREKLRELRTKIGELSDTLAEQLQVTMSIGAMCDSRKC